MKKRLRKKLRKAEFTEYMVSIEIHFVDDFNVEKYLNDFLDRFLDFIDANRFLCSGIFSEKGVGEFHVSGMGRERFGKDHREIINSWLTEQKEITNYNISELEDAWN